MMQLKKILPLKKIKDINNLVESKISSKLNNYYDKKVLNLENDIENLKSDNILKNQKIDELNRKVAFYEKETKDLTNDIVILTNVIQEVYTLFQAVLTNIELEGLGIYADESNKKKKVYH